jgi:hypothetical protein
MLNTKAKIVSGNYKRKFAKGDVDCIHPVEKAREGLFDHGIP